MNNSTKWILIIGSLGIAALFLLKKKEVPAVAIPAVPGVPTIAPPPTTTEGRLKALAMEQLGLPESGLTVRGLTPQDLGITTFNFTYTNANAYNTLVNTTVADNRFIAITGVGYPPNTTTNNPATNIRITAAGSVKEIWNVQTIPAMTNPIYTDPSPSIIEQNQPITIDVYSTGAVGPEALVFNGIVVEKRGLVLA